jgi:hypothetical protein
MIPEPGYIPEGAQPGRAMSQADIFVQQTRAQAAQQLSQPAAAFTGGIGGAQPGIMSYAAGKVGAFAGGFGASMQQSAGAAMGSLASVPAATAAFATPGVRAFGDIIEGARYQGGGAPPMSLSGMLATAYAPTGLFPHAGMAFGMERGLRRELAREELGRRWTQGVRGGLHGIAHGATLGLSSYMMRRSGIEASYLTQMETERTLQNRLGVMRGGPYASATGFGVRRGFFTEGPGEAAIDVLQQRAGALQSQYGYGVEQMNMLTRMATGAIDTTRVQQFAGGGRRGMREMGREIADIRETAAAMAREMQMSEQEIQEFFGRLKGVMQITGEGIQSFRQENRRLAMQGPFSQRQVAEMRTQFTQVGRQMYMGGAQFGTEAMQQANRVAELRRQGVISAETLLREGGGLDPQAMARMIAQRLQQQAGLVQAGQFNQELVLAGQNPGAYQAMLGGAGFMETQAALGQTMVRNPFALLQAQLDPNAVRRVTMQAPTLAFQRAQQLGAFFVGNEEQRRSQMIRQFGKQMGFNVQTAAGLGQARTRYEEIETQRELVETELRDVFQDPQGRQTRSERDIRKMGASLMGIMQETGESANTLAMAMQTIQYDTDLSRRWSSGSAEARSRLVREVVAGERAATMSAQFKAEAEGIYKSFDAEDPEVGIKKARSLARSLEKQGVSNEMIQQTLFGDLSEFQITTGPDVWEGGEAGVTARRKIGRNKWETSEIQEIQRSRMVHVGAGKFEVVTEEMSISTEKMQQMIERHGLKSKDELMAHLNNLSGWHSRETKEVTDDLDKSIAMEWDDQLRRSGKRLSVESIRQGALARDEWARARRKGAGVFDIMRRLKIDVGTDMVKGLQNLLDLDTQKKEQFQKLEEDSRMRPLVEVIKRFGGEGVESKEDFRAMTGMIGVTNMRSFFKEYAASEEGAKKLGGKTFADFIGRRPVEKMHELFQGMSKDEKRAFMVRTLSSAIEKSQRLVNEAKLGDSPTNPTHVLINADQVKKMAGVNE